MKVLVLQSELGVLWGGGETFTTSLFKAFAQRGHGVTAAFVADSHGRYPRSLPSSFETIAIRGRWSRKRGQAALSSIGEQLPAAFKAGWGRAQEAICWRTVRWHNRRFQERVESVMADRWREFDAVYVNGNVPLAHRAASHRPTMLMLPGPVSDDETHLLPAIHAVCSHDDGYRCIQSLLGEDAVELPLGLDAAVFRPGPTSVRSQLGWSDREVIIGYVGRLALIKGVDVLAAAFVELSRAMPEARLLMVGSGEEEQRIRSILASECARGLVHLQPRMSQEELPAWFRAMDLMVMPSRYETMSNAVLEGLACGVPFVASAVGGSRDLVKTGNGWLFTPESPSSLNTVLQSVLERRHELKCHGVRASQYVHQKYSWASSAERLERIIETRLGVSA